MLELNHRTYRVAREEHLSKIIPSRRSLFGGKSNRDARTLIVTRRRVCISKKWKNGYFMQRGRFDGRENISRRIETSRFSRDTKCRQTRQKRARAFLRIYHKRVVQRKGKSWLYRENENQKWPPKCQPLSCKSSEERQHDTHVC